MRSILEKALIALLNEEKDVADALFHDFILERSRQIHESLRQGEDFILDESMENELAIDEMFSESDLDEEADNTPYPATEEELSGLLAAQGYDDAESAVAQLSAGEEVDDLPFEVKGKTADGRFELGLSFDEVNAIVKELAEEHAADGHRDDGFFGLDTGCCTTYENYWQEYDAEHGGGGDDLDEAEDEFEDDDLSFDELDGDDEEIEGDDDQIDAGKPPETVEDRVTNLEKELQALAAEFDAAMDGEDEDDEEDEEETVEEGTVEIVAHKDGGIDITATTDDDGLVTDSAMDMDMGDDLGLGDDELSMDDFDDLAESAVDELERVTAATGDGREQGNGKFKQNTQSVIKNHSVNDRAFKGAPVKINAKEHSGYAAEPAPTSKTMPTLKNGVKKSTDNQSTVKKEGNPAALLNKGGEDKSAQSILGSKRR